MSPLPSAMPIPSMATSTVPRGAKLVKLVTIRVSMRWSPSTVMRLTGLISSPVPGWVTTRSNWAVMAEATTTPRAMRANRVPGCGSAFPTRSIQLRARSIQPALPGPEASCGGSGGSSVTVTSSP